MRTRLFSVRETSLDLGEAVAAVFSESAGALSIFVGTVRNHNDGKPVTLLEYQAYSSMAEKQMAKIATEIEATHPGVRLAALHRVGALQVGDSAVICVASSAHRHEAFVACRLLIDRIKEDVPVWKREHGPDGPYWVGWEDARCRGHDHNEAHHHHEVHDEAHTASNRLEETSAKPPGFNEDAQG
jgi:molybdopterin synthase catalytic subunit